MYGSQNYGMGLPMPAYQQPYTPMFSQQPMIQQPQQQMVQQPQVQQTVPTGNMRIVDNFSNITANEVPMDGSVATFIKSDHSEIQLKSWDSNGTIRTVSFVPQIQKQEQSEPNVWDERLNALEEQISRLEGIIGNTKRTRKEVAE